MKQGIAKASWSIPANVPLTRSITIVPFYVVGILVDLIGEIIEKEEEKKKKEVCNGVLKRKEPLTDGRKEQAFTYPTDVEYREDDLWMDTGCQEFAGDSSITEMEEE